LTALRILFLCLLTMTANCTKATEMKTISEVKRAHEAMLIALPDVVSVGIGRDENGEAAIVVGLARDNERTIALVPEKIEGYPVIVKITGAIRSQ
jgi:hypothetical protein